MAREESAQFKALSAFARKRVRALCKFTGMTATEVVEDALRDYVPPGMPANMDRLARRGVLLVRPGSNKVVNLEEANEALDRSRERDLDH